MVGDCSLDDILCEQCSEVGWELNISGGFCFLKTKDFSVQFLMLLNCGVGEDS